MSDDRRKLPELPPQDAPRETATPDPDYIADLETSRGEGILRNRMKLRERGRVIPPPRPR
jgi:hypothetical protein